MFQGTQPAEVLHRAATKHQPRRKIHTNVKVLTFLNALPKEYCYQIDRSQISRYRATSPEDYFGTELSGILDRELDFIRQLGDFPKAKAISTGVLKTFVFFRSVVKKSKGFYKSLRKEKEFFVELFHRFRPDISAVQFSKLIGIDVNTLRNWALEVKVRCKGSVLNLCPSVHINQLYQEEVQKMKKLLENVRFQYWPLVSIYYYALRKNSVSMALSTWYKYARILNIRRLKPKSVKSYGISVRATLPNQYWHADVMKFRTVDGVWNYVYTVVDNFSKFPLSVLVSDTLSGELRIQSFRDALKKAIELCPTVNTIKLVVDGGCENFNGTVNEFLKNLKEISIHRIRALRDVAFSNSVAEAFNRILKTFYLNHQSIANTNALIRVVEEDVNDFAFERPHGKLKGLTPYEAITGVGDQTTIFKTQIAFSRAKRIEINRKFRCVECKFK